MKVLICDDHQLYVDVISAVLEDEGVEVVARTGDPEQAVKIAASGDVDVCILDLTFPSGSGLAALQAITSTCPEVRVVVVSAATDAEMVERSIAAGASAYLSKVDALHRLIQVMRRVSEGETNLGLASRAKPAGLRPMAQAQLTAREAEALAGLVRGESTKTLAARMKVRPATARTHVQNVLSKLGVHTRLEAVAFALRHDLVLATTDTYATTTWTAAPCLAPVGARRMA